jgi:hypothetical protein
VTKDRTTDSDAAADPSAEAGGPAADGSAEAGGTAADHGTADAAADDSANAARAAEARRAEARRRCRVDEVFGDVLPTTTRDERDPGRRGGFSLEHYRASKPPHWGDKQ